MKLKFSSFVKPKNETTELTWREHSAYSTRGEAKQKSIRIEMFTGKPTKVVQDERTRQFWIMVGFNPQQKKINQQLGDFTNG